MGASVVGDYEAFLASKARVVQPAGHEAGELNPALFPFQADCVRWALRMGRAALFHDCGLGKTLQQLEWARNVPGDVLILAPLAVAAQTRREGEKFGIPVTVCRSRADVRPGINVTNYEMLEHFDPDMFTGVVLDESSILKAYEGKTRNAIVSAFARTPYRLACTATPAPNDYMELGNHAEFLGVMKTYREKLLDPRWQKKRLEVLERAGWACEVCEDKASTLHVHHGVYERGEPWEASDGTLWCLCASCHDVAGVELQRCQLELGRVHPLMLCFALLVLSRLAGGATVSMGGDGGPITISGEPAR